MQSESYNETNVTNNRHFAFVYLLGYLDYSLYGKQHQNCLYITIQPELLDLLVPIKRLTCHLFPWHDHKLNCDFTWLLNISSLIWEKMRIITNFSTKIDFSMKKGGVVNKKREWEREWGGRERELGNFSVWLFNRNVGKLLLAFYNGGTYEMGKFISCYYFPTHVMFWVRAMMCKNQICYSSPLHITANMIWLVHN